MATEKNRRERWYSITVGGVPMGADMGGFNATDPINTENAVRMVTTVWYDEVKLTFLGFNYDVACQIASAPMQKDTTYRAWKESNLRWKGVQDDK